MRSFIVAAAALLAFCAACWVLHTIRTSELRRDLAAASARLERLGKEHKKVESFKSRKSQLERSIRGLNAVRGDRVAPEVLEDPLSVLREMVRVESLILGSEKMSARIAARDIDAILKAAARLASTPRFGAPDVHPIELRNGLLICRLAVAVEVPGETL